MTLALTSTRADPSPERTMKRTFSDWNSFYFPLFPISLSILPIHTARKRVNYLTVQLDKYEIGIAKTKISGARGLLSTDLVILNHGQVTWKTPEKEPFFRTSTPHQREGAGASTYLTFIGLFCTADLQQYWTRAHDTPRPRVRYLDQ
ncbi:hypothetical protein TNCV_3995911 [Trichonephila clavipes]|nr:hypothetical protein TNCV_3995911 [Trichonephila clavipes]